MDIYARFVDDDLTATTHIRNVKNLAHILRGVKNIENLTIAFEREKNYEQQVSKSITNIDKIDVTTLDNGDEVLQVKGQELLSPNVKIETAFATKVNNIAYLKLQTKTSEGMNTFNIKRNSQTNEEPAQVMAETDTLDQTREKLAEAASNLRRMVRNPQTIRITEQSEDTEAAETQVEPAKPAKKLLDIKRGENDRFFTGPNYTSKKNRLGAGRLEKAVQTLIDAPEGSRMSVTYRNVRGHGHLIDGEGILVHNLYDHPVAIRTPGFEASIVDQENNFEENLVAVILYDD